MVFIKGRFDLAEEVNRHINELRLESRLSQLCIRFKNVFQFGFVFCQHRIMVVAPYGVPG